MFAAYTCGGKKKEVRIMEKTLIVYYSNSGTTEKLAMHVKKLLPEADIDRIGYAGKNFKRHSFISALFKVPGSPKIEGDAHDPKDYGRVVLLFPVWAGMPAPVMRSYINKHGKNLTVYSAVWTSGGEGSKPADWILKQTGKAPQEALEITQKKADAGDYNLTGII